MLGSQTLLQVDGSPQVLPRDLHLPHVIFELNQLPPRTCLADWKPQVVTFGLLYGNCLRESRKRGPGLLWGAKVGNVA